MPKARVTKVIDGDTFKIPRKVIRLANARISEELEAFPLFQDFNI